MTATGGAEVTWAKSSYSETMNCLEFSAVSAVGVLVRDSKNPDGPHLTLPVEVWRDFLDFARLRFARRD